MANFDIAYHIVHGNEAGYANVAKDKGGETYCGISRVWHPTWPGWLMVDMWKALHGTPERGQYLEVPGLVEEVLSFFRNRWDDLHGDELRNQDVANQLYDFSAGTGLTVKIAQQVLVGMGFNVGKNGPDNAFGLKTLAAINAADPATFYNRLKQARIAYYHYLVAQDASQEVHLAGWLARANRFLDLQKKTVPRSSSVA
jgi:lysozyme family protein